MGETHVLRLLGVDRAIDGELMVCDERWDGPRAICDLSLHFDGTVMTASSSDYFEALRDLRRRLDAIGLRPSIYGASRNVWPSGMCRDMGLGCTAYRMTLGRPALQADLVSIFDTGPDVEPVGVDEQRAFFDAWLASLGLGGPRPGSSS